MATKRMLPDWANDGATTYVPDATFANLLQNSGETGVSAADEPMGQFWRKVDPTNPSSKLMQQYDAAGNKIGEPVEWKGGGNIFGDLNPDTVAGLGALALGGYGLFGGAGAGIEGAAAVEAGGGGAGLLGAEAMAVPELAAPSYALSGGTATLGAATPAATGAAMTAAGAGGATGLAGLLGSQAGVTLAGGLLGAMAGKDTTTTASKDPWGPAQPYLLDNLKTNAAMQQYYQANPFSDQQKTAYQGLLNSVANGQANAPVMQGIANNFMQSNRGRMAQMPQFTQGTTAAPINWAQYANIGKA